MSCISKTPIIIVISIIYTTLLFSSVGAFISSQHRPITIISPNNNHNRQIISRNAAYIDENFPHGGSGTTNYNNNNQQNVNQQKQQPIKSTNKVKKTKPPTTLPNGGKLTLVGAGPGSPDLLTLSAYKIITDPNNYLIVDRLVSQEILDLIQGEYKVANKYRGCADIAQEEIYDWCVEGLKDGKHVVRLKIGTFFNILLCFAVVLWRMVYMCYGVYVFNLQYMMIEDLTKQSQSN
jgi:hypothetical protein